MVFSWTYHTESTTSSITADAEDADSAREVIRGEINQYPQAFPDKDAILEAIKGPPNAPEEPTSLGDPDAQLGSEPEPPTQESAAFLPPEQEEEDKKEKEEGEEESQR